MKGKETQKSSAPKSFSSEVAELGFLLPTDLQPCCFTFCISYREFLPKSIICQLKRCTMCELQVKFYLWENEGCSLGDSTSDSSERLLQRGSVVVQSLSRVRLFATPQAVGQAPLSMGLSQQEYWSGLPFPSSGNLPDPGIELTSPTLAGGFFFTTEPPEKPQRSSRERSYLRFW